MGPVMVILVCWKIIFYFFNGFNNGDSCLFNGRKGLFYFHERF